MKTKYYIYHIPGIKIGVSDNPDVRTKTQGFSKYEILEEHTNIKTVSEREIELQKQYGYPVDKVKYWKVRKMQKKAYTTESQNKRLKTIEKYNWSKILKEKRTPKINYKAIFESRNEKDIQAKRIPKMYKPVNQYDLKGNFIKQWESQLHAIKELNLSDTNGISACCTGRQKTSQNFIWEYAN